MQRLILLLFVLAPALMSQVLDGQTAPVVQQQKKSVGDLQREYFALHKELSERLVVAYRQADEDTTKADLAGLIGLCRIDDAAELLMDDIDMFNLRDVWPVKEAVARLGSAAVPLLLKRVATTPPEDIRSAYYTGTLCDITGNTRIVAAYLEVEAGKQTDPEKRKRLEEALARLQKPKVIGLSRDRTGESYQTYAIAQRQKELHRLMREYIALHQTLSARLIAAYRQADNDRTKAKLASMIGVCHVENAADLLMDDIALLDIEKQRPWEIMPVQAALVRLGNAAIRPLLKRVASTPAEDGRLGDYISTLLNITGNKRIVAAYLEVEAEKQADPAKHQRLEAALAELKKDPGE